MNIKLVKVLRRLIIVLVCVLLLECAYLFVNKRESTQPVYFDSINDIESIDNGIVGVGSNNNNEEYNEKAKFTMYDSKNSKTLEKIYNKGNSSSFFGIDCTNDGCVAVGSMEVVEKDNLGEKSALIVKYDFDGNVVFEDNFQVLGNSRFMDVIAVDDGYLVVGQSIYENMTLGFSNDGGAYLIKYDTTGKIIWKMNYGDNKLAIYNAVIYYDGYIYVVGKDLNNVGIVSKYSNDGAFVKSTSYAYTDGLGFSDIIVSDGFLYVCGGKVNEDIADAIIVKYDLDLEFIEEKSYSCSDKDRYNRLLASNDGGIVVVGTAGYYDGEKDNKDINVLRYDGIVAKYKNDLEFIKVQLYGSERDMHFTDVLFVNDNYLVSGYSVYEDNSYMEKFVTYSDALKVLEVQ